MISDISSFMLVEDFSHDDLAIRISAAIKNKLLYMNTQIHARVHSHTHRDTEVCIHARISAVNQESLLTKHLANTNASPPTPLKDSKVLCCTDIQDGL